MIFKHLFTPKWKHPKVDVRAAAIEKLDLEKDASVLQTLALEDESAQIRKQVLTKVNDLGLWWKAYKQDGELKELAEQKISSAVINQDNSLQSSIRDEYIERYAATKTLEKVALQESDHSNKVKLLKRLANSTLIEKVFKEGSESLQLAMLELVAQHRLEKALLKSAQGEALTALNNTLEQQRLAKEMPVQVAEETRVVLAKLNALRDKHDYEKVQQQANALFEQWQGIELKWLDDEAVGALDTKFQQVSEKLNRHIAELEKQYSAQQAAQQLKQNQALESAELNAEFEAIEKTLEVACKSLDITPYQALTERLEALQQRMQAPQYLTPEMLSNLQRKSQTLFAELNDLPQFITASDNFNQAIAKLESVTPPSELSQFDHQMQEQKEAYIVAKHALAELPAVLSKEAKAKLQSVSHTFLAAVEPLREAQEKALKQGKKKARDVQRLIDQGRFNVAFGVFNGFMEQYERLTPEYKKQLEKQHESLSKALEELKDWQKYAATPKRDELLQEVEQKLGEENVDPVQRAEEVKRLRKRWNELGHVETEQEKVQAAQFDDKIEQLFAPCRAHFAEQEQQREQAKQKRQDIVAEMTQLAATVANQSVEWREIESQFNRIAKAWKSAGNVDAKSYQQLNNAYREQHQAVYEKLKGFHQANAEQKAQLVAEAEQLLASDDLAAACEQLKTLQKQWQQIGFAGAKQEHSLWKAFRAHNDAVFEKRSAQYAEQKQQEQAQEQTQRQQLAEFDTQLIEAVTQNELLAVRDALNAFAVVSGLKQEKSRLLAQVAAKLDDLFSSQRRAKFNELVQAVENTQTIPSSWQGKNETNLDAQQLLLRLEILTNQESPAEQQSQRMAQQVAMLDAKLQGEEANLETYLVSYLAVADEACLSAHKSRLLAVLNA